MTEPSIDVDGEALVHAKSRGTRRYEALVEFYRARGASDLQMLNAMVKARRLISPLKLQGLSARPRGSPCITADVVPGGLETVLNLQPKNWAGTRPARKEDRYV